MILVQAAVGIYAVTLESQEFALPNPKYCKQAFHARTVGLLGGRRDFYLRFVIVVRHSLVSFGVRLGQAHTRVRRRDDGSRRTLRRR